MLIMQLILGHSRVIGLQASSRETIDIRNLLSHELSPVPTSMFTDSGDMRIGKSKTQLKTQLQVELSTRKDSHEIQCRVLDGSAVLWVIHWPLNGKVPEYVANFRKQKLEVGDVELVFGRYMEYSTKSTTRSWRATEASRVHKLNLDTPLLPQKVVLTVSTNKKQLIDIIGSDLSENKIFHYGYTQNLKNLLLLAVTTHQFRYAMEL